MARLLALFPLSLIVFPGEKLNLHIFEPRYRQLVRDCIQEGITFGIPPYLNNSVGQLGTEVKLLEVEKVYPSGEMDIRTQGIGVFRIREFYRQAPDKLYAAGKVEDIQDDAVGDSALQERITEQVRRLYDILGLRKLLLDLPTNYRIFDVAHHLGMSQNQEYQLLAATSELERQEMVREHLDQTLPVLMETERLKDRARLNGHFKNLTPPNF